MGPEDLNLTSPTLLLDKEKCLRNIREMVQKAKKAGVEIRPHAKTHFSGEIAKWQMLEGINGLTVSSVDMAAYFSEPHYYGITIAFPFNFHEAEKIKSLSRKTSLEVVVENAAPIYHLPATVGVMIKIDTGYRRTGISWDQKEKIDALIREIQNESLQFRGFLIHAGHAYDARGKQEVLKVHEDSMQKITKLKTWYGNDFQELKISIGDTPTCSVAEDFGVATEIRPGNFVFYDLMQRQIGSCTIDQIAVKMAVPVVAVHPERNEVVVHGGAVHFSKEYLEEDEIKHYGKVIGYYNEQLDNWDYKDLPYIKKLSQEHGIIHVPDRLIGKISPGDWMSVLPVHSCLTANLMRGYVTMDGERISTM